MSSATSGSAAGNSAQKQTAQINKSAEKPKKAKIICTDFLAEMKRAADERTQERKNQGLPVASQVQQVPFLDRPQSPFSTMSPMSENLFQSSGPIFYQPVQKQPILPTSLAAGKPSMMLDYTASDPAASFQGKLNAVAQEYKQQQKDKKKDAVNKTVTVTPTPVFNDLNAMCQEFCLASHQNEVEPGANGMCAYCNFSRSRNANQLVYAAYLTHEHEAALAKLPDQTAPKMTALEQIDQSELCNSLQEPANAFWNSVNQRAMLSVSTASHTEPQKRNTWNADLAADFMIRKSYLEETKEQKKQTQNPLFPPTKQVAAQLNQAAQKKAFDPNYMPAYPLFCNKYQQLFGAKALPSAQVLPLLKTPFNLAFLQNLVGNEINILSLNQKQKPKYLAAALTRDSIHFLKYCRCEASGLCLKPACLKELRSGAKNLAQDVYTQAYLRDPLDNVSELTDRNIAAAAKTEDFLAAAVLLDHAIVNPESCEDCHKSGGLLNVPLSYSKANLPGMKLFDHRPSPYLEAARSNEKDYADYSNRKVIVQSGAVQAKKPAASALKQDPSVCKNLLEFSKHQMAPFSVMIDIILGRSPRSMFAYGLANPSFLKVVAVATLLNQVVARKLSPTKAYGQILRLFETEEAIGYSKTSSFSQRQRFLSKHWDLKDFLGPMGLSKDDDGQVCAVMLTQLPFVDKKELIVRNNKQNKSFYIICKDAMKEQLFALKKKQRLPKDLHGFGIIFQLNCQSEKAKQTRVVHMTGLLIDSSQMDEASRRKDKTKKPRPVTSRNPAANIKSEQIVDDEMVEGRYTFVLVDPTLVDDMALFATNLNQEHLFTLEREKAETFDQRFEAADFSWLAQDFTTLAFAKHESTKRLSTAKFFDSNDFYIQSVECFGLQKSCFFEEVILSVLYHCAWNTGGKSAHFSFKTMVYRFPGVLQCFRKVKSSWRKELLLRAQTTQDQTRLRQSNEQLNHIPKAKTAVNLSNLAVLQYLPIEKCILPNLKLLPEEDQMLVKNWCKEARILQSDLVNECNSYFAQLPGTGHLMMPATDSASEVVSLSVSSMIDAMEVPYFSKASFQKSASSMMRMDNAADKRRDWTLSPLKRPQATFYNEIWNSELNCSMISSNSSRKCQNPKLSSSSNMSVQQQQQNFSLFQPTSANLDQKMEDQEEEVQEKNPDPTANSQNP